MVGRLFSLIRRHPLMVIIAILIGIEAIMLVAMVPAPSRGVDAATAGGPVESVSEILLGDFKVRNHQMPGDDHVIKFSLCLVTAMENHPVIDAKVKERSHRIRESVAVVARRAGAEVLAEDTLATLKRRIRVAIVGVIDGPDLPEFDVLLPDFLVQKG